MSTDSDTSVTLETVLWAAANFISCAPDQRPPEQRDVVLKGLRWAMENLSPKPSTEWEAKARKAAMQLCTIKGEPFSIDWRNQAAEQIASFASSAYSEGVKVERERCAKIAKTIKTDRRSTGDDYEQGHDVACDEVAAAIEDQG